MRFLVSRATSCKGSRIAWGKSFAARAAEGASRPRSGKGRTREMHLSGGGRVYRNGESTPAATQFSPSAIEACNEFSNLRKASVQKASVQVARCPFFARSHQRVCSGRPTTQRRVHHQR